jgi:hypothetical protein
VKITSKKNVRFKVLKVVRMMMMFWVVTLCRFIVVYLKEQYRHQSVRFSVRQYGQFIGQRESFCNVCKC